MESGRGAGRINKESPTDTAPTPYRSQTSAAVDWRFPRDFTRDSHLMKTTFALLAAAAVPILVSLLSKTHIVLRATTREKCDCRKDFGAIAHMKVIFI
jgi:hypothetical protein